MKKTILLLAVVMTAIVLCGEEINVMGNFPEARNKYELATRWALTPAGQTPVACKVEFSQPDVKGIREMKITSPAGQIFTRIITNTNFPIEAGDTLTIEGEACGKVVGRGNFGIGFYAYKAEKGAPVYVNIQNIKPSDTMTPFKFAVKVTDSNKGEKVANFCALLCTSGEATVSFRNIQYSISKKQ